MGGGAKARPPRPRGHPLSAADGPARDPGEAESRLAARIPALDWSSIADRLDTDGHALVPSLLSRPECRSHAALYDHDDLFRSRVIMSRHGFGRGEYRYFAYPLPRLIAALRSRLYPPLAAIANRWNEALRVETRYPAEHAAWLERCHRAGQTRPTPLMLRYGEGDYNRLHQDLYGEHVFPIQATILLSVPGRDFEGGEFVLTEQRPRMQSRAEVVPLGQGDAVLFPVHHRPVRGTRGFHRANLRHGVSRLRSGHRHALGIIFPRRPLIRPPSRTESIVSTEIYLSKEITIVRSNRCSPEPSARAARLPLQYLTAPEFRDSTEEAPMDYDAQRALDLLRAGAGQGDAEFREGQEDAIRHIVEGHGRLLVVQKTGWGKSFVYFIVTKLLRGGRFGTDPSLLTVALADAEPDCGCGTDGGSGHPDHF